MCGLPGGEFAVLLRGVALAEWAVTRSGAWAKRGYADKRTNLWFFCGFFTERQTWSGKLGAANLERQIWSGKLGAANLERQTWSGIRHPTALCASDAGTRASHTERLTRSGLRHPTALCASDAGTRASHTERLIRSAAESHPELTSEANSNP